VIITSVVLLVTAFVFLVLGALQGSPTMLGISLGAAGAGALSLLAGTGAARRAALARGVPVETVLAGRLRRPPPQSQATAAQAQPATAATAKPPPIDGYDGMPASEVTRLVSTGALADDHLSEMLVYEASHRRRRTLLTAIMEAVGHQPAGETEEATARKSVPGASSSPRSNLTKTADHTTR
jgi:hypothetical protein